MQKRPMILRSLLIEATPSYKKLSIELYEIVRNFYEIFSTRNFLRRMRSFLVGKISMFRDARRIFFSKVSAVVGFHSTFRSELNFEKFW